MVGVIHDLNNLLQVIHGHAQIAVEAASQGTREHHSLSTVVLAAEDAAAVTRLLLSARQGTVARHHPVDLVALLEQHCRLIGRLMGSRIVVRLEAPQRALRVPGDEALLRRVLLNLTLNARDAMPEGGTLTLTLDTVHQPAHLDADGRRMHGHAQARLTLTDTGTGMTPEVLERVFTPFFSTKGPRRGTGLGLYMVQDIVQRHSGTVEVHSMPGQGTSFCIHLPLAMDPGTLA